MNIQQRLKNITQNKLRSQDAILATYEKELQTVITNIGNEMQGYLKGYRKAGVLSTTQTIKAQLNLAMKEDLMGIFDEQGYTALSKAMIDSYDDIAMEALEGTFKTLDIPLSFAGTDLAVMNTLQMADFQEYLRIADQSANAIHSVITQAALSNMPFSEVNKGIKAVLSGTMQRYSRTIANTGLMMFDATTSGMKYEEAGVERYRYVGPLDTVTRDFCRSVLKIQPSGGYTRAQINALSGRYKQPGNPFIFRGGFNCRHSWVPAGMRVH